MSGLTPAEPEAPEEVADRRRSLDVLFFVLLLVAGLVLAGVWRLVVPAATGLGDEQETQAAVDGTLALLQAVAGVVTGILVLVRPGARPARRSFVVIVGSAAAGAISWQLGDLLGTPALTAVGAAFIWPVATSLMIFVGAMLPLTSRRLNDAMPPSEYDYSVLSDDVRPDARPGPSGPS